MGDSETAAEGTSDRQVPFSVLAVTSHRPDEVRNSLSEVDAEATVLVLDSSGSRLRRVIDNYREIRRALSTQEPDLILLDCYEIPGTIVAALSRRENIPIVARLVGDTWRGYGSTRLRSVRSLADVRRFLEHRASYRLNDFVFGEADGYVAVSTALGEIVQRRTGCRSDRIGVVPVPMTVDTSGGSPQRVRRSLGIDESKVVVTVTNLSFQAKYEGVRTVLRELQPLLEADPELAYVVAGDGRFFDQVRRAVAETVEDPDVRERIYTPGYVESVTDLYALADVFAYVSYRDGYPNAVLEAQTAGLAVVANDAHGMRDQITDGETGYLIEPSEAGALRGRVAELLASPERRRQIGKRARKRVLTENTPGTISRRLEAFLREFLRRARGDPSRK